MRREVYARGEERLLTDDCDSEGLWIMRVTLNGTQPAFVRYGAIDALIVELQRAKAESGHA